MGTIKTVLTAHIPKLLGFLLKHVHGLKNLQKTTFWALGPFLGRFFYDFSGYKHHNMLEQKVLKSGQSGSYNSTHKPYINYNFFTL